jgi:PAS domain S-box-containing protein
MISANAVITGFGFYDYGEVARSILIAIAASYVALDLAGRVTAAKGQARALWLMGGAVAMGTGIWEMNFQGLLAYRLPVPVVYHWPTVLASYVVAVFASAVALYIVSRQQMGSVQLWAGSLILAGGIAATHYIGMTAMRLAAVSRFDLRIAVLSVMLAIVFSLVALTLAFGGRQEADTPWQRIAGAMVMGAAISAMHYTGMASANFFASEVIPDLSDTVNISPLADSGVVIIILIVLAAAILTSSVDRLEQAEARRLNQGLEQRVAERTRQLTTANEELRREIAERQGIEDSLRRSEDNLRLVIDTIPQQIWSCSSPEGNLDYCNAQWYSYMGFTQEDLRGEGWQRMLHPEDKQKVLNAWQETVAHGTPYEQEERHRRADGQYRWFLARGVPLRDSAGHIVRWYGTNTDIEDRKRAEWAVQELQAGLSHVTRVTMMGELVTAIAHEVNQPLAAIVTNANFCLRQFANANANSAELREAISEIVNDGTRASAIISRIRALLQKSAPERVAVDINEIIQEVTTLLRSELTRNRISLRTDLDLDISSVSGDRVQLQQVVINLVINGIEAMRLPAHKPRELLIKSIGNHDEVRIHVQDSGEGVDLRSRDHIFEPFFTTKPTGIGMGLSISRSIVESHGGRLWTESGSQGGLFQFTLPTQANGVS